jgi:hypothetical protein
VLRNEFEAVEEVPGRDERGWLLEKDSPVDTGKLVRGESLAPVLELLKQR